MAFELRSDSTYEVSNRTLASGIIVKKVQTNTVGFVNEVYLKHEGKVGCWQRTVTP